MKPTVKYIVAMVTVLVIFAMGLVVGAQSFEGLNTLPAAPHYQANSTEISIADIYSRASQSVVKISVMGNDAPGGLGSGFVIDEQGHIVTNNHVAGDAAYIEVEFVDGTIAEATLIGHDPGSDLAVIKVDPAQVELHPIPLANSDEVFVGQEVLAIGSPYGEAFTLTTGIVSAIDRSMRGNDNYSIAEVIQTDAAINPGNSGGPLLDMAGNVVGVNTAIRSESQSSAGIGFAVPSNLVRRVVPYLIANGTFEHTWMGISGSELHPRQRAAMGLANNQRGVMVAQVVPDSPAANAGLIGGSQAVDSPLGQMPIGGDVITAVNGVAVGSMGEMIAYLEYNTLPGDTVTLDILRNGQAMTLNMTLVARPNSAA